MSTTREPAERDRVPTEESTQQHAAPLANGVTGRRAEGVPVAAEDSAVGERPVIAEGSAVQERPVVDERSVVEERTVTEERPVAEERPMVVEPPVAAERLADRSVVVDRERAQFGGVKVGSAFFGWLTATGTTVILTALLAASGAALGLGVPVSAGKAADEAVLPADTVGWIGAIALLVILFVAYYCGGYVAGRMARFNGVVQGLAVWVWALVMAIAVALLSVAVGSQYDILGEVNSFPRIPVSDGELTIGGIVTAVVVAVASLGGAILGGKFGTRYHRKVDRVGFGG